MGDTLVIDPRYCGPETSGNGGWTSGAVAGFVDGRAEVSLRHPPPLGTPLQVHRDGAAVQVLDGDRVVAEARPVTDELEWPPFVDLQDAIAAQARFGGHTHHEFPSCFTCGVGRAEGDGLRIFAGPVEGRPGLVAATWTPDATTVDGSGQIPDPIVWAALDCPSVWPFLEAGVRALLGRMTAVVERRPVLGETYVVVGRGEGADGRKLFGSAALYTTDGDPVAVSRTTWITIGD